MKQSEKYFVYAAILLAVSGFALHKNLNHENLKIVIIRHGEKPEKGNNLSCKGLNRALMLPEVIHTKFGVPNFMYVPSLKMSDKTSSARMFETVVPLAVKYNLDITSKFEKSDSAGVVNDILQKQGTVLLVWEHKAITGILHSLGIANAPKWADDDYNTIYIITFVNDKPVLAKDTEGLNPSDSCR
ncbi:MAG TPA: histidine phosphatase family protein [Bacteroidia bacterium]|jgi:hypothetical protein|nr:histidine phosphatase family protein [Bacteroidia bacterium]